MVDSTACKLLPLIVEEWGRLGSTTGRCPSFNSAALAAASEPLSLCLGHVLLPGGAVDEASLPYPPAQIDDMMEMDFNPRHVLL